MATEENIEKIKALILNKVKKAEWHYYEITLNEALANFNKDGFKVDQSFDDFLNEVEIVNNEYQYSGSDSNIMDKIGGLLAFINSNPSILKQIMKRIFDTNDELILNNSDADEGLTGKFNEKDRKERNKIYFDKIRKGFRAEEDSVVIMAEGDSWFEFPRIFLNIDPVQDIIDYLIDEDKFAIYSLAAGGDWLSNMMYTGEYISELPKVSPDVFLISGGGNDMVGDNRLATMVRNPMQEGKLDLEKLGKEHKYKVLLDKRSTEMSEDDFEKYKNGLQYIHEEFFLFIDVCMVQYFLFFLNFQGLEKYKKMIFITQGYDYALPSNENRGNWVSVQRLMNIFMDTGNWLFQALNMKAITNEKVQEHIVFVMIHEFNEMLIQLAEFEYFPNVFHIDCRGVAEDEDDWYDELHLKSEKYEEIAKVYKQCIYENLRMKENKNRKKVYKVHSK